MGGRAGAGDDGVDGGGYVDGATMTMGDAMVCVVDDDDDVDKRRRRRCDASIINRTIAAINCC